MNIVVIGGGITGQLVQFCVPEAQVFDWGQETDRKLTREWGANYLWEPIHGLPTRYFSVVTHIDGAAATSDAIRRYKAKVGKSDEADTPKQIEKLMLMQFPLRMTGHEFTEPIPATIQYNKRAMSVNLEKHTVCWADGLITNYDVLVNTIPLYAFLNLIADPGKIPTWLQLRRTPGSFTHDPIFVRVMSRPPDAPYPTETLYVNYLTAEGNGPYRYCDRNGERHYEGLTAMGQIANKKIVPGKIHDMPHAVSQSLGVELNRCDVYCVGRFGAWRSDELVHQTYRRILAMKTRSGM